MNKFKVGDRVRVVKSPRGLANVGDTGVVNEAYNTWIRDSDKQRFSTDNYYYELELLKEAKPMSKYSELKAKIEALNNGWTKEVNEIINEIKTPFNLIIPTFDNYDNFNMAIHITKYGNERTVILKTFEYGSQCEKNSAFKKALLCLLDHSYIKKDDHSEEIKSLREDIKKIEDRIKDLEQ